jgi:hypothetical protein
MQSEARRRHSNSYLREPVELDTAFLIKSAIRNDRTATRVPSVAYATEKGGNLNFRLPNLGASGGLLAKGGGRESAVGPGSVAQSQARIVAILRENVGSQFLSLHQ